MKKLAIPLMLLYVFIAINEVRQIRPYPQWLNKVISPVAADLLVGPNVQFTTLPPAIAASICGDSIRVQVGTSYDVTLIILPDKGCGPSNPIRITTTGTLPDARVSPASASQMPRFRAITSDGVFRTAPNAGYWILDGLNLTDNMPAGTQVVTSLIDFTGTSHHLTVMRSLLYPKEAINDPANWNRPLVYGIRGEGSGLVFKWGRIYGLGLRNGKGDSEAKAPISCINGDTISVIDSFLEGGYIAGIFTGGGDEPPQNTSAISNATFTSADFTDVTNLAVGMYVRFNYSGTGSFPNPPTKGYSDAGNPNFEFSAMTRTGGTSLVDFDGAGTHKGFHIRFTASGGPTFRGRLKAVAGNNYTIVWEYGASPPVGTYSWIMWGVAEVKSLSGSKVTYAGVGPNGIMQAPDAPGQAAWRKDQVVHDISVTGSEIHVDPAQAIAEWNATKNSPKACFEFKSGHNLTLDGNHFTGYPCAIGPTQHSNEGVTPWTKVDNLVMRGNFVNPILDTAHNGARQFAVISLTDPYNTDEPGFNVTISNNLILNMVYLADLNGDAPSSTTTITHNTVINDRQSAVYGSKLIEATDVTHGFTYSDNISAFNDNGIHCNTPPFTVAACFPSGSFSRNVVVDNRNASVNMNSFGPNSILPPIPMSFPQVGFADPSKNDYRLSAISPYKGKGDNGSDPGVVWAPLVAALGFDPAGTTTPLPSPSPTPSIPRQSPTPTPAPAPIVESPNNTRLPPSAQVVDDTQGVWTIGAGGLILRNNENVDGIGSLILWCNKRIYVIGTDAKWWRYEGNKVWVNVGDADPCALAIPTPTPTPVVTPSPSPTPSSTPTPQPTPTPTPSPSPLPSPSACTTITVAGSRETCTAVWPANEVQQNALWNKLAGENWQGCVPMTTSNGNRVRCWRMKQP